MVAWHRMLHNARVLAITGMGSAGILGTSSTASAQVPSPLRPAQGEWFRDGGGVPAIAPTPLAADPGVQGGPAANLPPTPNGVAPSVPSAAMPNVAVPNAAQPAAPALPSQRPYRMPPPGNYSGGSGYGSVSGLYPSNEMNSYMSAMARAATARALFHLADSELGQAYRAAQRQFDGSPEYKQAIKEEHDSYDALTAARTKALSSLSGDNKYQRLLALRQDLAERLDDLRARHIAGPDEVVAMANLKMSYSVEMRVIETQALASEPSVKESQERLVTAGSRVSAMRQQYTDSLRVNPDITIARRNLEDARIAKLTSEAYLSAAMTNGSYALDYAYYVYRRSGNYGNYGNDGGSGSYYTNYRY